MIKTYYGTHSLADETFKKKPTPKPRFCFCTLQRGKEKASPFNEVSLKVEKDCKEEQK